MTATPHLTKDGHSTPDHGAAAARAEGILLIGDESFAASVRQVLQDEGVTAPVAAVGDYLMALGHAGTRPAAVVLGRVSGLDGMLESAVAGLRRLLPASQLLLVVAPDEEPLAMQAVRSGFNDYLIEPLDTLELARLVRAGLERAAGPNERSFRFPARALAPPGATPTDAASQPAPAPAPASPQASAPDPASAPFEPTPAPPGPAVAAPSPVPDAELGDVDLIARLLHDAGSVGDLALRVAAARSGIAGLTHQVGADQAGADQAAVPIVFDGTPLGSLAAPAPARAADLAPWATWLSHWLALDKRLTDLREAALKDELTGVWNRRYFRHFLANVLDRAADERFCVTLMVFDIDDFKTYNDRYGHPAGDEILRETAKLMQSVVRAHDVVARIGGDEFAVVFWDAEEPRRPNSRHPQSVRRAARRFQEAICSHRFPKLMSQAPGSLTISGGLAGFPWDGRTPDDLVAYADARALESKNQGKNALTFGPGAAGDVPEQ